MKTKNPAGVSSCRVLQSVAALQPITLSANFVIHLEARNDDCFEKPGGKDIPAGLPATKQLQGLHQRVHRRIVKTILKGT